jgi:anti-sigma factor RsiW
VRCSSCESLIDRYVEGTLAPRQMLAVSSHLRRCTKCSELLSELRVVDALISTTQPVTLAPNFTFAVMAEVRGIPQTQPRRIVPLAWAVLYTIVAWIAAGGAYVAFGPRAPWLVQSASAIGHTAREAVATTGGIVHGVAGLSLLVPSVAAVLVFDALLVVGAIFFYRAVRPLLARSEAP